MTSKKQVMAVIHDIKNCEAVISTLRTALETAADRFGAQAEQFHERGMKLTAQIFRHYEEATRGHAALAKLQREAASRVYGK